MLWINLFFLVTSAFAQAPVPKLLTKHPQEAIRHITMDGRFAYVKKRPGVLALVSYFRSVDFLSDAPGSDFIVHATRAKNRVAIEVVRDLHTEFNVFKNNKIFVGKFGDTQAKEVGQGQAAKLHVEDEWLTFFKAHERAIIIQNVVTQKKYEIRLSPKSNAFFIPQVSMPNADTVVYTDVNDQGLAGVIAYSLSTQKTNIIYKASQSATRLEICEGPGYMAIGEFPYEGVNRSSQILQVRTNSSSFNLASYTTIYSSLDQDIGNIVCADEAVFFVKTMNQDKRTGFRVTEAVKLTLADTKLKVLTSLNHVTQIIGMDGRIMAPVRGEFYVLQGEANLGSDALRSTPNANEELPLEI